MAKKKDKNEDPEEEKKNQFEEDDDFGLPDLDYDELEEEADLELEDDFEEPDLEQEETPTATAEPEELKEEPVLESTEDLDPAEATDDIDLNQDWEKELESELEEEIKSGDLEESFYEEESFDEFSESIEESVAETKTEESTDESLGDSVFGADEDDDFYAGIEPEPAPEKKSEPEPKPKPKPVSYTPTSSYIAEQSTEGKGKFTRTVIIGTILFLVVGSIFYILYDSGTLSSEKKKAVVEKPKPVVVEKKEEPKPKPEQKSEPKPEPKKPVANKVATGTVTQLPTATGKSYIVVASFFDSDIANDYAKELAAEGKSPYVIPPFKDHRFYRVAIAEYDRFNDASSNVGVYQQQYGSEVWPLRY